MEAWTCFFSALKFRAHFCYDKKQDQKQFGSLFRDTLGSLEPRVLPASPVVIKCGWHAWLYSLPLRNTWQERLVLSFTQKQTLRNHSVTFWIKDLWPLVCWGWKKKSAVVNHHQEKTSSLGQGSTSWGDWDRGVSPKDQLPQSDLRGPRPYVNVSQESGK